MAEQVNVLLREMQAAQNFARDLGAHPVMLVVGPDAVKIFAGVELAHIVEQHGHGAQPVIVEVFFGVVLHALQRVLKHVFRVTLLVAHLRKAGEGGHFRNKTLKNMGIKEQTHEAVHGFCSHLAPFVHDIRGRNIVEHAG